MRDFGSQAKYTVYCHTLFDGRKYFGKTSQPPSRRWRGNGEGYSGTPFYEAIKRYGWQAFDHETIATGLTELQAKAMEESLIKRYKTQDAKRGFNVTGGDGWKNPTAEQSERFSNHLRAVNTGRRHTDEYKRKMSERMKGEKNPNWTGGYRKHRGDFEYVKRRHFSKVQVCALCGTPRNIHIHHLVPYRLTHDNKLDNLIPLCASHHKKVETITKPIYEGFDDKELAKSCLNVLLRPKQRTAQMVVAKIIADRKAGEYAN